jgi:hypothetical protein
MLTVLPLAILNLLCLIFTKQAILVQQDQRAQQDLVEQLEQQDRLAKLALQD